MPRSHSRFSRTRAAAAAAWVGALCASALPVLLLSTSAGCRPKDPMSADDAELPRDKQEALMKADKTISDGQRMTEEGVRLRDEGKSEEGERMIREGETMKARGEQMRSRAMMKK